MSTSASHREVSGDGSSSKGDRDAKDEERHAAREENRLKLAAAAAAEASAAAARRERRPARARHDLRVP